jgi:retron-type reverse transcriptase
MSNRLINFLDANHCLFKRQFGFRSKHSTEHALISLTESIRKNLDSGQFACGIFIDLQKAFDTVDHEILLTKLKHYGIRGIGSSWFRSFLSNRSQFVEINGIKSTTINILYGVPQGSVLGPLLFLIYINDLHNALCYSNSHLFADDTTLLFSGTSLKSIGKKANIDLKLLVGWLNANKISLNSSKTELLIFRSKTKPVKFDLKIKINGRRLFPSSYVKYLGVYIDEHLLWYRHVNDLSVKLRRAMAY